MSVVGRSCGFSQYLRASKQTVPCQVRAITPAFVEQPADLVLPTAPTALTSRSLMKAHMNGNMKVSSSFTGILFVR